MSELEKHEHGCDEHEHKHKHEEHDHCCGHDHEHEEHDHCCEHDHEHEEHDHCCGHDHEHEEHDHCCGHDHEHEHEIHVDGFKLFETHVHEGATVCSFEKDIEASGAEAADLVRVRFEEIKKWLNEQGAIIGHVKGYIRDNGSTTTFSTVGAELNIGFGTAKGSELGFASIVFGICQDKMKDKVVEIFSDL